MRSLNPISAIKRRLARAISWRVELTTKAEVESLIPRIESVSREILRLGPVEQAIDDLRSTMSALQGGLADWERSDRTVHELQNDLSELRVKVAEISRSFESQIDELARRISNAS